MNESTVLEGLRYLALLNNLDVVPDGDFAYIQDLLDINGLSVVDVMTRVSIPYTYILNYLR